MGVMEWRDGAKYVGTFKAGLREGEGTLTWPDGRTYKGQWSRGKQDGVGIKVDCDGVEKHGKWRNGEEITGRTPPASPEHPHPPSSTLEKSAAHHGHGPH